MPTYRVTRAVGYFGLRRELVKRVAGAQERLAGDNEAARRYQDRISRA